jgi:hypothetical protein
VGSASAYPRPLGFGQDVGELGALAVHLGQDEVGRAVDDAEQHLEAVGGQGLAEGVDDRDAAAHAGFEVQGHVVLARQGEKLGAFLGDELLVGGDHVLAGRERGLDEHLCGLDPADDLDHHADVRVAKHGLGIVREQGVGQSGRGALGGVEIRRFAQLDGHAGLALEVFFLRDEQFDDAAADGSATDHSDPEVCAGHSGSPGIARLAAAWLTKVEGG